ncbi:MAG: hypothetical protein ACLRXQ_10895 [Phascolarctobacterium faecium]
MMIYRPANVWRRFSEGLHQAIEAKEGVKVERKSDFGDITFRIFLCMKTFRMTGTAKTEEQEFQKFTDLTLFLSINPWSGLII